MARNRDDQPQPRPPSPASCQHDDGKPAEEYEDGRGNVIGQHRRCTKCGIIVGTDPR